MTGILFGNCFSDFENEPCRLKRSFSERLSQGTTSISFNDTMALRNPRGRGAIMDSSRGSTLFDAVTDLQRLDGVGPTRPRPSEPPPPPPPPSLAPQHREVAERPGVAVERSATPPPRCTTELETGFDVATITETSSEKQISGEDKKKNELPQDGNNLQRKNENINAQSCKDLTDHETPPSAPPRKRSNSKQPITSQIITKKETVNHGETLASKTPEHNKDIMTTDQNNILDISTKDDVANTGSKQADTEIIRETEPVAQLATEGNNKENTYESNTKIDESKKNNNVNVSDNGNDSITKPEPLKIEQTIRKITFKDTSPVIQKEPVVFDIPKITIKSAPSTPEFSSFNENISSTRIDTPDFNFSYQKVKVEPSKTIVQINSPNIQVIPSTVHRLQIKNEFQETVNYNKVSITESPQRKTSIMINGDDCYSTVNVNDDVPIYQSSVVVNDYDSSKIEVGSGSRSSSVYITGDFQSSSTPLSSRTSKSEERPKKTLVILEGTSSAPSTPSPTIVSGQSTPESVGKTFVVLQQETIVEEPTLEITEVEEKKEAIETSKPIDEIDDKPSSEELQRLLKDPVEAVKRNLVPHVCGKADVERKPKSKKPITSNSLVARLLEDPFLGSLAEGLETNTVAKLIEDSLLKLRSQDLQDDDKDACSENESCPPYELMEAGSDCYSNHSNRSSVTEDELGTRSKFYQLLADAALSEVEEHHYECIRTNVDPIYEEIEIPPPLPSNPPPSSIIDDLHIDKQFTTRYKFLYS